MLSYFPTLQRKSLFHLSIVFCLLCVSLLTIFLSSRSAFADTAATLSVSGTPMGVSTHYISAGYGFDNAKFQDLGFNTVWPVGNSMGQYEPTDDSSTYGSPSIDQIKGAGTAIASNGLIPWSTWDNTMTSTPWGTFKTNGQRVVFELRNQYQGSPSWSPKPPQTQADWNEWWEHVFACVYWLNVRNDYRVDDWQILNEPDNSGESGGTNTPKYEQFVQYSVDALYYVYKTFLPGRTPHIMVSALSYPQVGGNSAPNNWQDDVLHWVSNGIDSASYHYYHTGNEWANGIHIAHSQLDNANLSTNQVWATEWGGDSDDQGGSPNTPLHSVHLINNLLQASLPGNNYLYGSDFFCWSSDQTYGLVDANGNPRTAYYAMRLAVRALNDAKTTYQTTVSNSSDLTALTTKDASGNLFLLITNQNSSTSYTVNADLSALYNGSTGSTLYRYDSNNADTSSTGPSVSNGHVSVSVPASGAAELKIATGVSGADTQTPSSPSNLSVTSHDDTHLGLSWSASTDNVVVDHYDIYANGVRVAGALGSATSTTLRGLSQNTTYSIVIKAVDPAGNTTASSPLSATTDAAPSGKYEAENGTLDSSGYASRNFSSVSGTYSGLGYVEGYWNVGASDTITVSVASAGSYQLKINYINGQAWPQTIGIYVNGSRTLTANLANGPDWNTWETDTETVNLNAGTNTIGIQRDSSDQGNQKFDYIQLVGNGVISTPVMTSATGVSSGISLSWSSVSGASSYTIYRSTLPGLENTTSNTTPLATNVSGTSYTDTTATAGSQYFYKIVANAGSGTSNLSNEVTATAGGSSAGGLPSPWQSQDVGSPSIAGSSSYSNGTFTVRGSGDDIWNSYDNFQFAYQPLNGDGTIIAHIASQQNTNVWAKAGVMIRETLTSTSTHAFMALTPGNGSVFQRRTSTTGSSTNTSGPSVTAPYWVKLVRSGNTFTGSVSSDGSSWTQVGSDTISMASNVYIGLAVTSHTNSALNTSTFDNVTVTAGALNRSGWVASASVDNTNEAPANALDGNLTTRYSTGASQTNGQWFQIDMQSAHSFSQIILDATNSPNDYPRGYQVLVSNDGTTWSSPVATGSGSSAITTITFPTQTARYIRVVQTGSTGWWWSIDEFNVYP